MNALLMGPGFLGTGAPLLSDLSLVLVVFTALLFTIGWRLAVRKSFEVHRWVQTVAVILNTIVVLAVMVPTFTLVVWPGFPGKVLERSYGVPMAHAFIGMLSVLLGLFIVLRANGLVPERLRFKNYKRFMRTAYVLYMLSTLLGVIAYIVFYVAGGT